MPAQIYRSARIVIQNSTNMLWTLDGTELLCGQWESRSGPPAEIRQMRPQSAAAVTVISTTLGCGVEAFLRFGSVRGAFHIHWSRPWVGDFEVRTELADAGFSARIDRNEEAPAFPVAMITVAPRGGRG